MTPAQRSSLFTPSPMRTLARTVSAPANDTGRVSVGDGRLSVLYVGAASLVIAAFVKVSGSDPLSSVGGFQSIYEPILLAASTLLFALRLGRNVPLTVFARAPLLSAFVYAAYATVTSLWSVEPVLSFGKGVELVLMTINAVLFVEAIRRDGLQRHFFAYIALSVLAVFLIFFIVNFVTVGSFLAMVFTVGDQRTRLWLAANHPLANGDMAALGCVCALVSTLPKSAKLGAVVFAVWIVYLTDARGSMVGLALSLLAFLVLARRPDHALRRGMLYFLGAAALASTVVLWFIAQDPELQATLVPDLQTLDGRVPLWGTVLDISFSNPLKLLLGWGYFASRFLLLASVAWAGHAHQVLLEVLLNTGVVGVLIFCFFCGAVWISAARDRALLTLLPYLVIVSFDNPILFQPTAAMSVLLWAAGHAVLRSSITQVNESTTLAPRGGTLRR